MQSRDCKQIILARVSWINPLKCGEGLHNMKAYKQCWDEKPDSQLFQFELPVKLFYWKSVCGGCDRYCFLLWLFNPSLHYSRLNSNSAGIDVLTRRYYGKIFVSVKCQEHLWIMDSICRQTDGIFFKEVLVFVDEIPNHRPYKTKRISLFSIFPINKKINIFLYCIIKNYS